RPGDVPSPPAVIDTLRLPRPETLGSAKIRRDTAAALRQRLSGHDDDARREVRRRAKRTPSTAATDPALLELREQLAAQPCADSPESGSLRLRDGRWRKTRTEQAKVHRRNQGRTSILERRFDQLTDLLVELDYLVATDDGQLNPTDRGLRLRRLF